MTELPLWGDPTPPAPARRRWVARCDDCGRRIWSPVSIRRRFGLLLGGKCYRKRARAARHLQLSTRIPVRPPGDIPGQLTITEIT